MNNTTQITEALKRLIVKDNRAFVAMLSGEWGIGKTYFWKNFVKQQKKEGSKINFTYISLFGYSSIQSLKSDILKINYTSIKPIIQQVIETKYCSKEIEYKLNLMPTNMYEELIKEDSNFVELLIEFLKLYKPTNIINALQSLENENDDYKWKIKQIRQKINQGKNK